MERPWKDLGSITGPKKPVAPQERQDLVAHHTYVSALVLIVSVPPFANAMTFAPEACACSKYDEKSVVFAIMSANEFGITTSGKQKVATLLTFISDVHAMGLQQAQGIRLTEAFYWDLNDETRRWSKAFFAKAGKMSFRRWVQMKHYLSWLR